MEKENAINLLKNAEMIHLATTDGNQPRLRPMALIHYKDRYWNATKTSRAKTAQILKNQKIEFLHMIPSDDMPGTLRATGTAKIIEDEGLRKELSEVIPFFNAYWKKPDDPNFTLIELVPETLTIQSPVDGKFYNYKI